MSYIKKLISNSNNSKQSQIQQTLVNNKQLPPLTAIILIQNWYRRYRAQLEARRRCTWMVYQSLEYSSEQDLIKLQTLFHELLQLADSAQSDKNLSVFSKIRQISDEKIVESELWGHDQDSSIPRVEAKYTGPRIKFPLTAACVNEMLTKSQSGQKIHIRLLLDLLKHARDQLIVRPNIQRASSSISRKITVVGDLHGNIGDFATILYKNGAPDVMNPYVFNGDYVDRGGFSVEVFCLVIAHFLLNPTAVFINRGNHEDHFMNCSSMYLCLSIEYTKPSAGLTKQFGVPSITKKV